MLEYLVVLLDDMSVSYCHSNKKNHESKLIDYNVLRDGIMFAMKENLHIQFVYPNYKLPESYVEMIDSVMHTSIKPALCADLDAEVIVFDDWDTFSAYEFKPDVIYVLRTLKDDLFMNHSLVVSALRHIMRLNIIILDIDKFRTSDFESYSNVLSSISSEIEKLYAEGNEVQLNLLTDRIMLKKMNNCDSGTRSITLAPDGRFYICPAFYFQEHPNDVGDIAGGLCIRNRYLLELDKSPLCRTCDSYQCRRCLWLNKQTTLEINIPSHEQCVVSHIERNASAVLLSKLQNINKVYGNHSIKEISYLDPMDVYVK